MSVSTHILDTALGKPAAGVVVSVARLEGEQWILLRENATDTDGRIQFLLPAEECAGDGHIVLRLRFETAPYFAALGQKSIYPYIDIVFAIEKNTHYHVPLLLTANGYTTYRGS
jgi:5-hydroxyisourate hydrolase